MVSFTAITSAISVILFAATTGALPANPPPTSTVLDFTLYTGNQAGHEYECWDGGKDFHVPPSNINTGACNQASTFYTAKIDSQASGYNCRLLLFSDNKCYNKVAELTPADSNKPCAFPGGTKQNLQGWQVNCSY